MDRLTLLTTSLILLAATFHLSSAELITYSITDGAAPEDVADWTGQLVSAWTAACGSDAPATVVVPAGTFYVSGAALMGPCRSPNIVVNVGGTIVAPASYTSQNRWIVFKNVSGLTISGGLFDGQGRAVWNCKNAHMECPLGATSLSIENSNSVWLDGVSSANSELFHILIHRSSDVRVTGVRISAPADSPNTDGIHIEESMGITIRGSSIGTGDDCISIGPGAANVLIDNIKCGPGHAISIGSLGSEVKQSGVRNVTAKNVEFAGTENGFRIKTWAKPSDGFVDQVVFRNATMTGVKNPIIIDQHYCPGSNDCPTESSGVRISRVMFEDVRGSSATEVAVELNCSDSNPCRDVWLANINLSSAGDQAAMSCSNVYGGSHDVVSPPCCLAQELGVASTTVLSHE